MNLSVLAVAPDRLERLLHLRQAVSSAVVGKEEVVELALITLLARGHLLLEDVPGVGKTTLARALSQAVGGEMRRVQFTSDMLPSDVLGVSVFDRETNDFKLRRGPVFSNILLADEINRASPRTQSALLEAMNEGQVSIDGRTIDLPAPFFVVATQNPQDFAGTFPLPESQLDRFMMRIDIGYPPPEVEVHLMLDPPASGSKIEAVLDPAGLLELQDAVGRVRFDSSLGGYLQALITATRVAPSLVTGASTRAGMSLARAARARALLDGRDHCIPDDVHRLALPILAHRIRLAAQSDGYAPSRDEAESVLKDVIARVSVPL